MKTNLDEAITDQLVKRFKALWERSNQTGFLVNPRAELLAIASKATHVSGPYFASGRWIFEVRDRRIVGIHLAPTLSIHARQRLHERFGPQENPALRAAIDILTGQNLSLERKRQESIGKYTRAVQNGDRIHIVKHGKIITVEKPRRR